VRLEGLLKRGVFAIERFDPRRQTDLLVSVVPGDGGLEVERIEKAFVSS
jgi:hypothetical protein